MKRTIVIAISILVLGFGVYTGFRISDGALLKCELTFGKTLFGDAYVSNKRICYGQEALEGNYKACLQVHNPGECVLSASQYRKEYGCDQVDDLAVRKLCFDGVFKYFSLEQSLTYDGIESVVTRETITLTEGMKLPHIEDENVSVIGGILQTPTYRSHGGTISLSGHVPFDCEPEGTATTYKQIAGRRQTSEQVSRYVYIDRCTQQDGSVEVEFVFVEQ